jgi:hypothetical protein
MPSDQRIGSGLNRESLELDYKLDQDQTGAKERDGYNRVMFYIGLIAFALIGASIFA